MCLEVPLYLCGSIFYEALGNPQQKLWVVEFKVSTAEWLALQSPDMEVPGLQDEREHFRLCPGSLLPQYYVEIEDVGLFTNGRLDLYREKVCFG